MSDSVVTDIIRNQSLVSRMDRDEPAETIVNTFFGFRNNECLLWNEIISRYRISILGIRNRDFSF